MAQFTNQAQLSYTGGVVNSNIAVGEIVEVLSAQKTAVRDTYRDGDRIAYVVSGVNSGALPVTGVTVTDDLGGYTFGAGTVRPLSYVADSVHLYVNGVETTTPTVTEEADGTVTFGGITLPAGASYVLIYEADLNAFAPLGAGGTITNTATVGGTGIATPVTDDATVTAAARPALTITKSIEPIPVAENGVVTYRFVIQNYGNTEADAAANVILTDTFDPILEGLTVTLDGAPLAEGTGYTYDAGTGLFTTGGGQITVPAATYAQDPVTGAYVTTPGTTTLTVTGTV